MPRNYSNIAPDTTITSGINASVTSLTVASATGYPATPFAIVIDPGLAAEEVCEVTVKAGTTFTVTRGFDGTTGATHASSAVVRHSAIAGDFTDLQTADALKAPNSATYIVQTADASLSNEQVLGALATGYLKNTTTTGVLTSQATPIPTADLGSGTASSTTFLRGDQTWAAAGGAADNGASGSSFEDYLGRGMSTSNLTPTGIFQMDASVSGAGTGVNILTVPDANAIGVIEATTGTTTTGRAGWFTGLSTFRFGGGTYTLSFRFRFPTALIDGTDTGAAYLGFIDLQTAAPVDGAYIQFSNASANFRYITRQNNTETNTDSTLAAAANTWYYGRIAVNAAGTSVTFTLGTANFTSNSLANSANIPTAAGRETGIGFNIIKAAGTNPRLLDVDYHMLDWSMTSRI